jgi:AhpD family alkylhydroperoxidase
MKQRLQFFAKAPEIMKAVSALNKAVDECGLEVSLLHLIKLRASQINGCSFCVEMHSREARRDGETEQRLYLVAAWKESPLFSERERAAFAWTEAVTLIARDRVPDAVYEEVRPHLNEKELADLTLAVATINAWNRLCIAGRVEPGHYRPAVLAAV